MHLHFWSSNHRRFNLFSAFSTSAGFCREDHETPLVTQFPSAGGEGIWIRRHKPPLTPKAKRAHHERGGVASRFAVSFSCHLTTSLLPQNFRQPFETSTTATNKRWTKPKSLFSFKSLLLSLFVGKFVSKAIPQVEMKTENDAGAWWQTQKWFLFQITWPSTQAQSWVN